MQRCSTRLPQQDFQQDSLSLLSHSGTTLRFIVCLQNSASRLSPHRGGGDAALLPDLDPVERARKTTATAACRLHQHFFEISRSYRHCRQRRAKCLPFVRGGGHASERVSEVGKSNISSSNKLQGPKTTSRARIENCRRRYERGACISLNMSLAVIACLSDFFFFSF